MSVRVLVVDDSAVVRQTLEQELKRHADIDVVGTAPDPYVARDMIVKLKPDVLTLDIEMPRMDGLSFLRKLMQHYPMPVIVVSSLAKQGSDVAVEAVNLGAVDVMCKPGAAYSIGELSIELAEKIRAASHARVDRLLSSLQPKTNSTAAGKALIKTTNRIIAIGSSTGGVQALERVVTSFPSNAPAMVITQHMPAGFTKSFAERLNSLSEVEVREAKDGDQLLTGTVLVAPGNFHTLVKRSGASYYVEVKAGPLINRHRPSVEALFNSVAAYVGTNAIGIMLTGMGDDGAKGMLAMKKAGALNIAQDEASCVVYGMPRVAVELGAVDQVLPLDQIAAYVLNEINRKG
jgi:two-component system chemotaxis response regulator CheB